MAGIGNDPKMGYYIQLSQVGLEMVAPIFLGWFLDSRLGTHPWLVTGGAILGCVGGIFHLVMLSSREPKDPPAKRQRPEAGPDRGER